MKDGRFQGALERLPRLALLLPGMACLAAGIWGGLLRLPLQLPLPTEHAYWLTFHGPLMVCGFLGTVIGLERAVGLRRASTYLPPALTAAGAVPLLLGVAPQVPMFLLTAGSGLFVAVTLRVVQLQRALFTSVMALGAAAWCTGNILWLADWPFPRVVPWWIAFLALTIVGERLDLSRFQRPSPWARPLLLAGLGVFLGGVMLSALREVAGVRVTGAGMLGLAVWLGAFDLARRTVRQPGLPRFMAVCLLTGYVWMGVSGAVLLLSGAMVSGTRYDAALHAFFVGFVFSMIFGHAPIIFPAVLNLRPAYRPVFYSHLALLHLGLLLRVVGNLADALPARQWGGALNALAVALFLANTVGGFLFPPGARPLKPQPSPARGNPRASP